MSENKPMTVGELIEKLKQFDTNLPIRICCPDEIGYYYLDERDIDTNVHNDELVFYGVWSSH